MPTLIVESLFKIEETGGLVQLRSHILALLTMDDGEVIGCIPIQLEASHRRKIEMLVHELPEIVRAGGSAIDVIFKRIWFVIRRN